MGGGAARVLVTGGSGFLGRAALAHLALSGVDLAATRGSRPPPPAPRGIRWEQADLSDPAQVRALVARVRPTHLLALAWPMGPGNLSAPGNYDWIGHSLTLIRAFAAEGGKRVAFCGSCMEYDWSRPEPLAEDTPLRPDSDYGAAKGALSVAFARLCGSLGLSGLWLRPFFLYGPGESPRRLVADVVLSLLRRQPALCTHGRQVRDFLHVDDAGRAAAVLLMSELSGMVNIASGQAVTLADLCTAAARQIGRPDLLHLGARPARDAEAPVVRADIRRLAATGFRPRFTIETGLADTIAWWRQSERENA